MNFGASNIFTLVCHSVHREGMRGCSQGSMHGCSQGGMHGCSGGACMVAPGGVCVVAPRGTCVVAPGGCVWLLPGGVHANTVYERQFSTRNITKQNYKKMSATETTNVTCQLALAAIFFYCLTFYFNLEGRCHQLRHTWISPWIIIWNATKFIRIY